jgi:hypothetical protein
MNANLGQPLQMFRQILGQSVLGPRGLTKAGGIWFAVAVLLCLRPPESSGIPWSDCILIWLVSTCRTIGGILINDLSDREQNHRAGKVRWVQKLPPFYGLLTVYGLFCIGLLVCLAAPDVSLVALVYLAAVLLSIAYSSPPFRFKTRGVWGLWQYGICCTVGYVLVPWAWLGGSTGGLAVLVATVFLDKWVMLNFHQIVDHKDDVATQLSTYAVRAGIIKAKRTLHLAAHLASLSMAGLMGTLVSSLGASGFLMVLICLGLVLATLVYIRRSQQGGPPVSALIEELPALYLGFALVTFRFMPILLLIWLSLWHPEAWLLAAISTGLLGGEVIRFRFYAYQ